MLSSDRNVGPGWWSRSLGGAAVTLVAVACNGTVVGVDESDFPAAYARVYCEALRPCCADDDLAPAPDCETTFANQLGPDTKPADAAGATFDPGAAVRCIEALGAPLAQCPSSKTAPFPPDVCLQVYVNKPASLGAACTSSYQCESQPSGEPTCLTSIDAGVTTEQCTLLRWLHAGESCAPSTAPNTLRECSFGSICDPATLTCEPLGQVGGPCLTGPDFGDTCEPGAVCDRLASKMCVVAEPPDAACTQHEQCEFLACVQGTCGSKMVIGLTVGVCSPP